MSPDNYRRIWNTDMLNKLLDKRIPWNPGLSRAQLIEGFTELMETGVYERPYFGDMMMAGIACGVRKRILIFNTNERTDHDPIAVIDPTQYGGYVDSEIPVVVAYDMVHFESLHPVESQDIKETVKLTSSYIAQPSRYHQEYGFTNRDMIYLVTPTQTETPLGILSEKRQSETKINEPEVENAEQSMKDVDTNDEESESQMQGKCTQLQKEESEMNVTRSKIEGKGSLQENIVPTVDNSIPVKSNLFRFGGFFFKELENGLIKCGVCDTECKRLLHHLNKCSACNRYIDLEKFKTEYNKYKARQRKKKQDPKQRNEDIVKFRDSVNTRQTKYKN